MELLTFSAVLSFAISMEEKAESFYRKAAEHGECGSMSEMCSALARKNESHRSRVVATRQENVTEMVLEPINDLDSSGYEVDVELTGLDKLSEVFHDSERVAMAPSAELGNVGTADIEWFQSIAPDSYGGQSTLGQHPYLIMHLYRLTDGVLQQIGRSDLKHAFFAANLDCACPADQVLYVGCLDLYSTSTNAWRSRLAPREELTSSTGDWTSLGSHFDGSPVNDYRDHDEGDHPDPFEHRLTATTVDLLTPGASYFIEAWYLAKGDIDIFNSMAYRGVAPQQGPTPFDQATASLSSSRRRRNSASRGISGKDGFERSRLCGVTTLYSTFN